jgi:hypothetical protein
MEKSVNSANGTFQLQNSQKYKFLLQNVANGKEKCPRLKNQNKSKDKMQPTNPNAMFMVPMSKHMEMQSRRTLF